MTDKKLSISDIILELERDENLFQWEIDGVFVWEIIRVNVFMYLQENSSKENYGKRKNESFLRKLISLFSRFLRNGILRNPFLYIKKKDIIILQSGRKYLFDNQYIDIYTHFIEKKFDKNKVLTYETNHLFDHIGEKKKVHQDFINFVSKLFSKFSKTNFHTEDIDRINKIETLLKSKTKIDIDLTSLINKDIALFKSQSFFYGKLLDFKNPKEIYFVNYVDYFALLNQAKIRNIKTVEMQHGLIIKEDLIYHFPYCKENELRYFSTDFFVWKDFSGFSGKLPLSPDHIIENDENHLVVMRKRYSNVEKENKSILVASQPFFSDYIVQYILKNAEKMPEFLFYYKIHPMQFNSFFENSEVQKLINLKNVKIISNELSIYELLSKCKFIIGIYSTSLFEAPLFKCIPLLLLTNKISYCSNILERKEGFALLDDEFLLDKIDNIN
jgi:hypothetical protein